MTTLDNEKLLKYGLIASGLFLVYEFSDSLGSIGSLINTGVDALNDAVSTAAGLIQNPNQNKDGFDLSKSMFSKPAMITAGLGAGYMYYTTKNINKTVMGAIAGDGLVVGYDYLTKPKKDEVPGGKANNPLINIDSNIGNIISGGKKQKSIITGKDVDTFGNRDDQWNLPITSWSIIDMAKKIGDLDSFYDQEQLVSYEAAYNQNFDSSKYYKAIGTDGKVRVCTTDSPLCGSDLASYWKKDENKMYHTIPGKPKPQYKALVDWNPSSAQKTSWGTGFEEYNVQCQSMFNLGYRHNIGDWSVQCGPPTMKTFMGKEVIGTNPTGDPGWYKIKVRV